MNINPLFDNVLVQAKPAEEVRKSGIVIPDTVSKEQPQEGEVLAAGPDCKKLKKGNMILFKTYSPTKIKVDGEEYLILKEEDVLATLSK